MTKSTSNTGSVYPGDTIYVTTTICNNGTGRNDIHLSEDYLPDVVFV
ncbi:MAG: hypothetical protein H6766_01115 [Candidatus Peribacteria bacterium]|nr:MAG: hypothetical protein H6766_01115 [Candidatus Peribacteria bacterium]